MRDSTLFAQYDARVAAGDIRADAAQREVLAALQGLCEQLGQRSAQESGVFSRWFGTRRPAPPGVYLWGNVGRGKSMLMDLFYAHAPVTRKRRIHFHAFMQEVHQRMHGLRQQGSDPVAALARQLAAETRLLCFDELQATDPAEGTLLFRLFERLFAAGVVVVSTSNRPPASLYSGQVQKEHFARFIALLEARMRVMTLSSSVDYRHMQLRSLEQVYFWPLCAQSDAAIVHVLERICDDRRARQDEFVVQGRHIPFTLYSDRMGAFTFRQLCEAALGPADYLAIARRLDTVILTGIPRLSAENRNEARRFVTLIDALYEHKVVLIATADAPPEALYAEGDGHFEFQRTVSRLAEMQSTHYLREIL